MTNYNKSRLEQGLDQDLINTARNMRDTAIGTITEEDAFLQDIKSHLTQVAKGLESLEEAKKKLPDQDFNLPILQSKALQQSLHTLDKAVQYFESINDPQEMLSSTSRMTGITLEGDRAVQAIRKIDDVKEGLKYISDVKNNVDDLLHEHKINDPEPPSQPTL